MMQMRSATKRSTPALASHLYGAQTGPKRRLRYGDLPPTLRARCDSCHGTSPRSGTLGRRSVFAAAALSPCARQP
eukprot:COSAG03_NODE_1346_length_4284_cov_516.917324_5_plen_75_part_00